MRVKAPALTLLTVMFGIVPFSVHAQGANGQRCEVAGGYSFMRDSAIDEKFPAGWFASLTGNVNNWFGVAGEVSGSYKTISVLGTDAALRNHTFLAGPTFSYRQIRRMKPFVHVLVGAARASADVGGSNTALAVQPGGGVDVNLRRNIGIRLGGDYRAIRDEGETTNEARFVVGIIAGLGAR